MKLIQAIERGTVGREAVYTWPSNAAAIIAIEYAAVTGQKDGEIVELQTQLDRLKEAAHNVCSEARPTIGVGRESVDEEMLNTLRRLVGLLPEAEIGG